MVHKPMPNAQSLSTRLRLFLLPVVVTATAITLAACGFSPLYARPDTTATPAGQGFNSVEIANIPDRPGQYLRNALTDRFYTDGRPDQPRFILTLTPIVESRTDLDLTKDSTVTRRQLRLTTHMTLREVATGQLIIERDLLAINSFNVLLNQYDTTVSEDDVRQNALDDLARQAEAQVALYFKRASR